MAGPSFNLGFAFLGFGSIGKGFFMDQLYRQAASGKSTAFFAIMFFYSAVYINSAAGVEFAIRALQDVDMPHDCS